jgi:hypothetical protein
MNTNTNPMSVTISTDNLRSLKALQLTAGAADWLVLPDGGFGIPSQRLDGAFYAADATTCSCPDAKYHRSEPCKHVLAVRLYAVLQAAVTQPEPRRLKAVA